MSDEIPVTEARAQFSDLVNRVGFGKERIVLTRHGRPLVALVPAEELSDLEPEPDQQRRSTVLDLGSRSTPAEPPPWSLAARDRFPPKA